MLQRYRVDEIGGSFENIVLLGQADRNITLYAQQLKAAEIAVAFTTDPSLSGSRKMAIIGGGAAGVTSAACLSKLFPQSQIDLYERENSLLHLQAACSVRQLYPHLYGWPRPHCTDEDAGLPILNWRADLACNVARILTDELGKLVREQQNITISLESNVNSVKPISGGLVLDIEDLRNSAHKLKKRAYDAVIVSTGFGPEKITTGFGNQSYWLNSSMPEGYKYSKSHRTTLISGNGDGGLIDLLAAALDDFRHSDFINFLTNYPAISDVKNVLLAIEQNIDSYSDPNECDVYKLYEEKLTEVLESTGLFSELASMLRPRNIVLFHTYSSKKLRTGTSILNRLSAFLLLKGGEYDNRIIVKHIYGNMCMAEVTGEDDKATGYRVIVNDKAYDVDDVKVRHGPDKRVAISGFEEIYARYEARIQGQLRIDPLGQGMNQLSKLAKNLLGNKSTKTKHRKQSECDISTDEKLYCCLPMCNTLVEGTTYISESIVVPICNFHREQVDAGEVPMSLISSISEWMSPSPDSERVIITRRELLSFLNSRFQQANWSNLRINYNGPLMFHPEWYHRLRDELEYPSPNLERGLFSSFLKRGMNRYDDVKIIFRNNERYVQKVRRLIPEYDRSRFVADTIATIDQVFGNEHNYGPDLLCLDHGFNRNAMIVANVVVDMDRQNKTHPATWGKVISAQSEVRNQKCIFDRLFAESHSPRSEEITKLKLLVSSVLTDD